MHDQIRALAPHIGARTFHPDVEGPVKIWRSRYSTVHRVFRGWMHRHPKRAYRGVLWERLPRGAGAPGTWWPTTPGA